MRKTTKTKGKTDRQTEIETEEKRKPLEYAKQTQDISIKPKEEWLQACKGQILAIGCSPHIYVSPTVEQIHTLVPAQTHGTLTVRGTDLQK